MAGGRMAAGGGPSSVAGAGPGPLPAPPVPTPLSDGPETSPALDARPRDARLPAAGGGGAYSSVSVGLAWGRLSAEGSTATAMRTASAMASSGGYFRAQDEPFRRSSMVPSTVANRDSPRTSKGRETPRRSAFDAKRARSCLNQA